MIKNEIYQKSIRWLKENDLYYKWKNNVTKQNTLYDYGWLKAEVVNSSPYYNIIQYGFNWDYSNEHFMFWLREARRLVNFLKNELW